MKNWKFTVYDPKYKGRKTVYVEAATKAAGQAILASEGYTNIRAARPTD